MRFHAKKEKKLNVTFPSAYMRETDALAPYADVTTQVFLKACLSYFDFRLGRNYFWSSDAVLSFWNYLLNKIIFMVKSND